jgi:hypothetical protein
MFPRNVKCQDCGQIAWVRGYGRIEYDWPETTNTGHESTIPTINCVRLTIDCPHCGVKPQEFFPHGYSAGARHWASVAGRDAASLAQEVRFQRLGPMNRPRIH